MKRTRAADSFASPAVAPLHERVLVMARGAEELGQDAVGTHMLMNNCYISYAQQNAKKLAHLLTGGKRARPRPPGRVRQLAHRS